MLNDVFINVYFNQNYVKTNSEMRCLAQEKYQSNVSQTRFITTQASSSPASAEWHPLKSQLTDEMPQHSRSLWNGLGICIVIHGLLILECWAITTSWLSHHSEWTKDWRRSPGAFSCKCCWYLFCHDCIYYLSSISFVVVYCWLHWATKWWPSVVSAQCHHCHCHLQSLFLPHCMPYVQAAAGANIYILYILLYTGVW